MSPHRRTGISKSYLDLHAGDAFRSTMCYFKTAHEKDTTRDTCQLFAPLSWEWIDVKTGKGMPATDFKPDHSADLW